MLQINVGNTSTKNGHSIIYGRPAIILIIIMQATLRTDIQMKQEAFMLGLMDSCTHNSKRQMEFCSCI